MSPRPSTGNATPPAAAWPLQRQEVKSADGTAICAYWSPEAQLPADAPTVVLAADLAEAVPDVWRPQVEYLRDVRFVAWEYRGTRHAAAAPPTKRYDVEAHLEDLCAVLMEAGLAPDAPFMIMGSGVGVRIAL